MNFGKFKDAESLLRSYENLEKEFTKKCQELARLRFAKKNVNEMNTKGGALPRGGEIEKTEANTKNDRVQDAGGVNSNISNINESSSDRLVYESGRFAKKSTINAKNELSVESGRNKSEDSKMESSGSAFELERVTGKKTALNGKNELSVGSGGRESVDGEVGSGRRESVDDKVERGGSAFELKRLTGKKTTIDAKNELSAESGKSERVDDKMVSGKSEREAFGMKNNAEIKIGERVTKDKINRKGEAFLDKVYPPEESKCSKSKIENGETFLGSDLEEAGADRSSPFCGILESARNVLEGSALPENNEDEEELLRENLSFDEGGRESFNKNQSEHECLNGCQSQSVKQTFNGSKRESFGGSGSLNGNRSEYEDLNKRQGGSGSESENGSFNETESLYRHQSLSESRSSFKNGSEVESTQGFNQGDNLKAQKNDWSYGNDEESNINFGKNETEREGKIENVPTNVNASKPENAVIGTMTPELLELLLEKARTDGVQDYIKRVLDKKSNSPKLLGKSVRGDGLILNSGVKPLENIREAGNYILKNYFFD